MNGTITASQLKKCLGTPGGPLLVDVRTPSEYATGHVPGTINVPTEQIEARLEDLRPDLPIVLICQSGKRARLAAALLESHRTDVAVLDGGTTSWMNAGFPAVVNAKVRWSLERQVRLIAGTLVLVGSALAMEVDLHWACLAAFVGSGLVFAGFTDICPMASVLCRMPWNRPRSRRAAAASVHGGTCALKKVPTARQESETIVS